MMTFVCLIPLSLALLLCCSILPSQALNATAPQLADTLRDIFAGFPEKSYRPSVFWHWVNGNINKNAIDLDIEALNRSGYGGVLIYDVNAGIPKGMVEFNSNEWLELLLYAVDALEKYNLSAAMHNSPGYSGVGSENLPVNMSMKELVWTETRVTSNSNKSNSTSSIIAAETILKAPFQKLGLYEDLYALAYPVQPGEGTVFRDAIANTSLSGVLQATNITNTIDLDNPLRLQSSSDFLQFDMEELFTASAVAIYRIPETPKNTFDGARDYPPSWSLKLSNDSQTWSTVNILTSSLPALRKMDAPATLVFMPVTAKHFRLEPSGPSWVTGIDISSAPRLPDWATKSNAAPGGIPSDPATFSNATNTINTASVIDVSKYMDSYGRLNWRPENGDYTVVRIGYTTTGQDMPATPDDHGGFCVDLFSKEAIDVHMTTHLDRIINALEPYIPQTFFGMEIDSYELGQQNWGGNLAEDFNSLNGYSIVPWLLAATGRIMNSVGETEKFLFDFRSTHSHLTATNSYGYFKERLNAHGLALMTEPYGDGPFDVAEVATHSDFAYGEMWAHYTYGSDGYTELGASSSDFHSNSHVTYQEAFTGHPESSALTESPYNLKAQSDREMSLGTTHYIMHSYPLQPVEGAFPGMMFGPFGSHFSRTNPWSNQSYGWFQQISRSALLFESGTRKAEIACYTGEEPSDGVIISYNSPYDVPISYQADIFSKSNLLDLSVTGSQTAGYGGDVQYKLLVFPAMAAISKTTLTKIQELADAGVPIALQPEVPNRSISLNVTDSEIIELAQELWARAGNGSIYVGQNTTSVLQDIGLEPDFTFSSSSNDAALYFAHHNIDGEDFYFISNGLRKPLEVTVSLRSSSGVPEVWNPTTGLVTRPLTWSVADGRTLISFFFSASEAVFVRLCQTEMNACTSGSISEIYMDGVSLIKASEFPPFTQTPYRNISSTFTISVWVKPEVRQVGTTGYVFYPPTYSAYGTGHSATGFAMGINGLQVVEASTSTPNFIININASFSGWTHIALVYASNTPSIYVNGNLTATGNPSAFVVHPGIETPDSTVQMTSRFNGDTSGLVLYESALKASDISELYQQGLPPPIDPAAIEFVTGNKILIKEPGYYSATVGGQNISIGNFTSSSFTLNGPWTVEFPADRMPRDTPTLQIQLDQLEPLHLHSNFDVAHFSGTSNYTATLYMNSTVPSDSRILLNLGRVEVLAEVTVNGQFIGLAWLPPYELDISSAVRCGRNEILVSVTNLWPNRLIGDEYLPVEDIYNSTTQNFAVEEWPDWFQAGNWVKTGERVTFPAWKHWNKTDSLLASGLLGPVKVTVAETRELNF